MKHWQWLAGIIFQNVYCEVGVNGVVNPKRRVARWRHTVNRWRLVTASYLVSSPLTLNPSSSLWNLVQHSLLYSQPSLSPLFHCTDSLMSPILLIILLLLPPLPILLPSPLLFASVYVLAIIIPLLHAWPQLSLLYSPRFDLDDHLIFELSSFTQALALSLFFFFFFSLKLLLWSLALFSIGPKQLFFFFLFSR